VPAGRSGARPRRARLSAFTPGRRGRYPGSTHVRVLRWLRHPAVRERIASRIVGASRRAGASPPDLLLVQRTALPVSHVKPFVEQATRLRVPLVVELDDDLFAKGVQDLDYGHHLDGLAVLLEASALTTVSTEVLRQAIVDRAPRVAVVPNMIDERLWLPRLRAAPRPPPPADRATRLVYTGSVTHAEDLELLRPALEHVRLTAGLDVELSVIGGEPRSSNRSWYRRIEVPRGCGHYPRFVRWLRTQRRRWDIAVAPLAASAFNASKSDLKFLEYSALGLPGVYSDVPAFATCEDGVTGLKAANTVEAWSKALIRLCTEATLRSRVREEAYRYVVSQRCLVHAAGDYAELLCGVLSGGERSHSAADRLAAVLLPARAGTGTG